MLATKRATHVSRLIIGMVTVVLREFTDGFQK